MKLLMFLLLSYSVLGAVFIYNEGSSNRSNDTKLKIELIKGELYEYQKYQMLYIKVNRQIIPSRFTNITFKANTNYSKRYYPYSYCYNNISNNTEFACDLDLSYVPQGEYVIESFYYENEKYYNNYSKILIKGNKNESIQLIDVYTYPYEFSKYQNISLLFSKKNLNYRLIKSIWVRKKYSIYSNVYEIPLNCFDYYNYSTFCLGDFSNISSGNYSIDGWYYNNTIISNITKQISFYVYKKEIEPDIKLLNIYGDAYSGEINNLSLYFNKNVTTYYFSYFFLIDLKTNYTHNLNYTCYRNSNYSYLQCKFSFKNISPGDYLVGFTYKNKTYNSYVTLNVKEKKSYNEFELLNVYSNFKEYEENQVAYFSFYGNLSTNMLAYIVLDDEYSRKYVIQTLDCKNLIQELNKFVFNCKVNLTYVSSGKYSVSEYYIYNKHYYSRKDIKIVVQ